MANLDKKKIITIIIALGLLAIIATVIILAIPKDKPNNEEPPSNENVITKNYSYQKYYIEDDYEEAGNNSTKVLGLATNANEYKKILSQNKVIIREDETVKEKDYTKEKYILVVIKSDACSENILENKTTIEDDKTTITFDVEIGCGVCGDSYTLYEIAVPKNDELSENIEVKWNINENPDACDPNMDLKPILYLYPEKKTDITIDFSNENLLTTTYPKFENSWQVTVHPNGDIYDQNNKYYYALYWESLRTNKVDFNEGFYVSKDNAITFLEEKLPILGLNDKERNEFIMYWLPILESNEHNLIYFELTEELQSENKLIIEPQPDTLIRIRMHVKKVSEKTTIKEQQLTKATRQGFTAIEWGGVLYN